MNSGSEAPQKSNFKSRPATHLSSAVSAPSPSPYSQSSWAFSCLRNSSRCCSVVTAATASLLSTCTAGMEAPWSGSRAQTDHEGLPWHSAGQRELNNNFQSFSSPTGHQSWATTRPYYGLP